MFIFILMETQAEACVFYFNQNAQVAAGLSKFSIISILFDIIFVTPLYGLNVVFKLPFKEWFFSVISISVIFVILSTLAIVAINITKKDKKL